MTFHVKVWLAFPCEVFRGRTNFPAYLRCC